ncbi:unnamed protein product [Rotaria sordida]|uniref:Uncharacterized protein n=1 Tax=Rotaria sordida TaxID=392033 RepID=A0A818XHJ1_9BILA|nr:unnamed protein product [Rotaria sordida]
MSAQDSMLSLIHMIDIRCICHLLKLGVNSLLEKNLASNHFPVIYVPSLMPKIKMTLSLQELRERQKVLYQAAAAVSYYMTDSSVDFDGIQYELDMPDVFASFRGIIFLHVWFLYLFVIFNEMKILLMMILLLAVATWKHFCHFQPTPLERLVTLVTYIRKNIRYFEQLLDENFMKNDYIYFLSLYDDSVNINLLINIILIFKK